MRYFALILTSVLLVSSATVANAASDSFNNILNPSISNIPKFIAEFLRVIVMVALPIISLAIVYSGFLFVWARGNDSELQRAKRNFLYVIVGTILILGAWVIATLIAGTVSEITTGIL